MTVIPYEAKVASASVDPLPEPTTLPRAIRAIDAPPAKPIEWLIRDLWPAGELGLLVGDGGAFKSTVALHLAAAIAGGYPVFDRYPTQLRPTMIVSAEDSQDIVLMRLEAIIAGHGWSRTKTLGNTYLMCDGEPSLGSNRWRMHLSGEIERVKPGFIVLDPWAELQGGDENSNTDARPAIKFLRSVAKSVNAAVAVVHHAGKAGQDKRTLDRIRGASALPSASRVIWFFDYQDTGVAVECLKLSRAPKTPPFVVKRGIQHAPGNRGLWTKVQLTVEEKASFELSRAEEFVVEQLQLAPPATHTTKSLRSLARDVGRGISQFDMGRAIPSLLAKNVISFNEGKQNTRYWFLTPTSEWSGPKGTRGNGTGTGLGAGQGNSRTEELSGDDFASTPNLFEEPVGNSWTGSTDSLLEPVEPVENLSDRLSRNAEPVVAPLKGATGFGLAESEKTGSTGSHEKTGSTGSPEPEDVESLLADVDERLGALELDDDDEGAL